MVLGAARAMRDRIGIREVWPLWRPLIQQLIDSLRGALGGERFEAMHREGATLRSEEAIDRALAATEQAATEPTAEAEAAPI